MSVRIAVTLIAGLVLALPLNAAVIEEVVVTAQKREQNVQDVGIAISAVTGEQMRQLGYTNAQQVTALAPGVHTVQPNGEANYAIAMRGVAANDFTTNVESPVAIYLDEVYISQMSGSGFMLFDMERVELLRGPQGTLYGRNATGGLAHFVTVKPSREIDGYGQLTLGSYDQVKFEGAVGGGLGEDVMIYGSWNRGVKGGGYNSPVFPLSPPLGYDDATMSYDPEQLDAFEVGFKSRLADGLAIFNGAAYYYDYKDYQAFQIIGLDTITTSANADSYGFELELQATPSEGLDLILGMAYNDIEVSLGGGPKTTSVQSPKWNLNGLVRYAWPVAGGELAAQFDALYRSRHFFSLTGLETVEEDGYAITNASLSYTSADGGFTVTGFVHNLGDVQHLVQTFDLSGPDIFGMVEQYYNKPRWWGISLAMNF